MGEAVHEANACGEGCSKAAMAHAYIVLVTTLRSMTTAGKSCMEGCCICLQCWHYHLSGHWDGKQSSDVLTQARAHSSQRPRQAAIGQRSSASGL